MKKSEDTSKSSSLHKKTTNDSSKIAANAIVSPNVMDCSARCNDPEQASWTLVSDTRLNEYREVYP